MTFNKPVLLGLAVIVTIPCAVGLGIVAMVKKMNKIKAGGFDPNDPSTWTV